MVTGFERTFYKDIAEMRKALQDIAIELSDIKEVLASKKEGGRSKLIGELE